MEWSPEEELGARRREVRTQEAVGPVTEGGSRLGERGQAEMLPSQGWAQSLGLL